MWSATDWSDSGMGGTVRLRRRMIYRPACMAIPSAEQRTAVIDLGSNSFRLVVFTAADGWWKRTDEIYEAVRIGAGLGETGELGERADAARPAHDRGVRALLPGAGHHRRAPRRDERDPRRAQRQGVRRARARATGLPVRVLSTAQEALTGTSPP